jgi:non-specific serine/threonine protein kinase
VSGARPGSARYGVRVRLPTYSDLFAGRDAERAAVGELLAAGQSRLVTLTGPPGIGKTRLAVACAHDYAEQHGDDAIFVDLVPLRDPGQLLSEVARTVGIQPRAGGDVLGQLTAVLNGRELLVLIDNCEHLLDAAPQIGLLSSSCPRLRLLATSRERLRIGGEQEFPVPPLPMPSVRGAQDLDALAGNPSVAVLVDRARRTFPGFAITEGNAAAIAEACIRLEGLPLALELAAARLKLLTPGELVFRLDRRMELLASTARDVPARQRALRAAIAWSHDLLTTAERALFRRLSVFVGNWTISDAESVCGAGSADVLGLVESLLDKSLLRRIPIDVDRSEFAMLESLRQFAAEQLDVHGETASVRTRHAAHFTDLAVRLESALGSPQEQTVWFSRPASRQADLRAALDHCVAIGDHESALGLAAALGWYAYTHGEVGAAAGLVDETLASAEGEGAQAGTLTSALVAGGVLAWGGGRLARADALLRSALERSEASGDLRHRSIARAFLGHVARLGGHYAEAARWHRLAADDFVRLGNRLGETWARHDMGLLARDRGDLDEAVDLLRRAARDFRDMETPWPVACATGALGVALCALGDARAAAPVLGEAMASFRALDDYRGVAQCFEALAQVACELAAYEAGARLLGAAAAVRLRVGVPPSEAESARVEAAGEALAQALGAAAADRLRQSGRTMPLDRALELAAAVASGRPPTDARRAAPAALTRRERQVAALVASGRTNRQIGRALGIAEKTAEVHLQHAMSKLGARSRAEVAAWAVANDLLAAGHD